MATINELWAQLIHAHRIVTFVHASPDGDTVGSCLAMQKQLAEYDVQVDIYSIDRIPDYIKRVASPETITEKKDAASVDFDQYDLILCLDIPEPHLITRTEGFKLPEDKTIVLVDHHSTESEWGDYRFVDSSYASCSMMVYEIFKQNDVEITNPEVFDAIALGIVTDTGSFNNTNVSPAVFRVISEMMEKGFDFVGLNAKLRVQSVEGFKFMGISYINIDKHESGTFAYSKCSIQDKENVGIPTNIPFGKPANMLRNLENVEFIFFMSEKEIRKQLIHTASFRSVNKEFDVSQIAEALGGGGHKNAAAARFTDFDALEDALTHVISYIETNVLKKEESTHPLTQ